MFTLFIVLHVIFCVFLILVILLQTGKGGGIGAAFGGGSQTVFGPRGAGSFIGKLTGTVAGLFMLTSIVLAYQSTSRSTGVEDRARALSTEKAKDVESVDLEEMPAPEEEAKPALEPDAGAGDKQQGDTEAAEPKESGDKAEDQAAAADQAAKEKAEGDKSAPQGLEQKAALPPGLDKKPARKPVAPAKPVKPVNPRPSRPS